LKTAPPDLPWHGLLELVRAIIGVLWPLDVDLGGLRIVSDAFGLTIYGVQRGSAVCSGERLLGAQGAMQIFDQIFSRG
jgi:hypothetical protein